MSLVSLAGLEKLDNQQMLSNLWSFISHIEREIAHSRFMNILLMCIFFWQIFSISVSSVSHSSEEATLQAIYFSAQASRLLPLLGSLGRSDMIGISLMLFIAIVDCMFFYCIWSLSQSSTKEEANNFKLKNS